MYDTDIAPDNELAGHCADAHVSRTLVHKAADREVLLSAAHPLADDRFAVWVRWPHDHLLHGRSADGARDSLIVVETMRQAGIYLSHRFHDVPMDHAFVLHSFDFHLSEPIRDLGNGADVVLDITVQREPGKPNRFRLTSDADILVGGRSVGRAAMRWDALAPRQYAVIRHRGAGVATLADFTEPPAAPQPLAPAAVGRDRDDAVLIADCPQDSGGWRLLLDTGHPALFDHASDHVPGMVIVEAFRQAVLVRAAQGAAVSAAEDAAARVTEGASGAAWGVRVMNTEFLMFGELDQPVTIFAEPTGPDAFLVSAQQGERVLARARVAGGTTSPLAALTAGMEAAAC
ncbi:ScbA/BarX family gamma-butyrolactone biosynthesis protein [Streptomyces monticola]|uniref:ScbA/BarX family gamma-butyrolactone biosynthesis protein n=1 Tax=Streptomyces monticola TaxID=2666263 RepID=A0ABW2JT42_9ACTN